MSEQTKPSQESIAESIVAPVLERLKLSGHYDKIVGRATKYAMDYQYDEPNRYARNQAKMAAKVKAEAETIAGATEKPTEKPAEKLKLEESYHDYIMRIQGMLPTSKRVGGALTEKDIKPVFQHIVEHIIETYAQMQLSREGQKELRKKLHDMEAELTKAIGGGTGFLAKTGAAFRIGDTPDALIGEIFAQTENQMAIARVKKALGSVIDQAKETARHSLLPGAEGLPTPAMVNAYEAIDGLVDSAIKKRLKMRDENAPDYRYLLMQAVGSALATEIANTLQREIDENLPQYGAGIARSSGKASKAR